MNEDPERFKLNWPEDESGKAERDDAKAETPTVDRAPMASLDGETILGGYFVDRVRRWRERRRRKG